MSGEKSQKSLQNESKEQVKETKEKKQINTTPDDFKGFEEDRWRRCKG